MNIKQTTKPDPRQDLPPPRPAQATPRSASPRGPNPLREILRHLRLWTQLVRMNIMSQMEYRANFVTGLLMEGGYLIVKLMYVFVVWRTGVTIGGFAPAEIQVFIGTFVLVTGFYAGIFMMNLFQLSDLVRNGNFDALLTKPVNTLFLATFRRSDIALFSLDVVAGLILVVDGLLRLKTGFNPLGIIGYALFLASGSAVGYALYLIPMTVVFRVVNASAVAGFMDSFWDFNNVPMVVYNKVGQAIGTFVLPMFVITNFPALFALGRLDPLWCLWGLAAPFIFGAVAILCWRSGLKHYASGGN